MKGGLAGAVILGVLAGAGAPALADEDAIHLHDGSGRDLTASRCAICHSLDYIPNNAPVMDRTGWQKSIQKMRERFGAPITDPEAQEILQYLAGSYAGKP